VRSAAGAKLEAKRPPAPSEPPPRGDGLRWDQWLYYLDGTQRGPIDVEDLIDLVLMSIPENTKVWHPGLEGWVQANQVREIADEIPPPLPIPGAQRGYPVDEDMPDFNTVPAMLRTVLIADEDAAFRKYPAMPLAAQGFTIYEAADGSAAWPLAVQNRPWMILADISAACATTPCSRACRSSSSRGRTSTRSATARCRSARTTSSPRTCRSASC
jgi:CheY-like chemotaxis protein